jgi:hypothetical protein
MTLIEMTVSLALLTVILGGSASLVLVASRALAADGSNAAADVTVARAAASQVVDDLKVASALTERTPTAVTMTVPDRTGDGTPETVRYAWGGTPGDPLTRSLNGGPAGVVAANVRALNLSYLAKTVGKPPPVEGAEVVRASHDTAAEANEALYGVTASRGVAACFVPPPVADAVSWRPTRCRVLVRRNSGAVGTLTLTVRYADAARKPAGAALATSSVLLATLADGATGYAEFAFPTAVALDPAKGVCLAVGYAPVSGTGCSVVYDGASTDAALAWATTADGGATWTTPTAAAALEFYAYGRVTTQARETLEFQPLPPALP